MKQLKLTLVLILIMSMVGIKATAHDFSATYKGKTIYYIKGINNKNIYDFCNIFAYMPISVLQEGS